MHLTIGREGGVDENLETQNIRNFAILFAETNQSRCKGILCEIKFTKIGNWVYENLRNASRNFIKSFEQRVLLPVINLSTSTLQMASGILGH